MPYRETYHWTVGYYEQTFEDYHFCICFNKQIGKAYVWKNPKYKPEDNDNTKDGKYAPHCALGNTGNIGIGICAMVGFSMKDKKTPAPITRQQFELACKLGAELAYKYRFEISPDTVFTHAEYAAIHAKDGKIDIDYLPFLPNLNKNEVYSLFRDKTQWYYNQIIKNNEKLDLI